MGLFDDVPMAGDSPLSRAPGQAPSLFSDVPMAKPIKRSMGEKVADTGAALAQGVGSVVRGVGTLGGLVTGNMNNPVTNAGKMTEQFYADQKSEPMKRATQRRSDAIDAQSSVLGKAGAAIYETVTDPGLFVDTLASTAASMLPAGAIGRLGTIASGSAKIGTAAAVGTGAVQAGADVSGAQYDQDLARAPEVWAQNPAFAARVTAGESPEAVKQDMALQAARLSFPGTVALSALSQKLPGAATLERAFAGAAAKPGVGRIVGAVQGGLGEATQEAIEEGGGQFIGNLASQQVVDPNADLMEGVGEGAGLGAVAGFGLGGVAGALRRAPLEQPPPVDSPTQPAPRPEELASQAVQPPANPLATPPPGPTVAAVQVAQATGAAPTAPTAPVVAPPIARASATEQTAPAAVDPPLIADTAAQAAKPGLFEQDKELGYTKALALLAESGKVSRKALSEKLGLTREQTDSLLANLQAAGVIGPQEGRKARKLLVNPLTGEVLDPDQKATLDRKTERDAQQKALEEAVRGGKPAAAVAAAEAAQGQQPAPSGLATPPDPAAFEAKMRERQAEAIRRARPDPAAGPTSAAAAAAFDTGAAAAAEQQRVQAEQEQQAQAAVAEQAKAEKAQQQQQKVAEKAAKEADKVARQAEKDRVQAEKTAQAAALQTTDEDIRATVQAELDAGKVIDGQRMTALAAKLKVTPARIDQERVALAPAKKRGEAAPVIAQSTAVDQPQTAGTQAGSTPLQTGSSSQTPTVAVGGTEGLAGVPYSTSTETTNNPTPTSTNQFVEPNKMVEQYDDSPDVTEDDITPPSGGAFSIRSAAEATAKRTPGGKVFEVDGGFVVRVPKAVTQSAEKYSVSIPEAAAPAVKESLTTAPVVSAKAPETNTSAGTVKESLTVAPAVTPAAVKAKGDDRPVLGNISVDTLTKAEEAVWEQVRLTPERATITLGELKRRAAATGESATPTKPNQTAQEPTNAKQEAPRTEQAAKTGQAATETKPEALLSEKAPPPSGTMQRQRMPRGDAVAEVQRQLKVTKRRATEIVNEIRSEAKNLEGVTYNLKPGIVQTADVQAVIERERGKAAAPAKPEAPQQSSAGPRVIVNRLGPDGLTDAERASGKAPYNAPQPSATEVRSLFGDQAVMRGAEKVDSLGGIKAGDKVKVKTRTIGDSTVEFVFTQVMGGFDKPVPMARVVNDAGKRLDVTLTEIERIGAELEPNVSAPTPAPAPKNGPYATWRDSTPAQRRELLRAARYTAEDQARVYSGTDWEQLPDPVRMALSAQPATNDLQESEWDQIVSTHKLRLQQKHGIASRTAGNPVSWQYMKEPQRAKLAADVRAIIANGGIDPQVDSTPAPAAAPTQPEKGIVGRRADGVMIREDERGVRWYAQGGVRIFETVSMRPTRQGMQVDRGVLQREFMTAEESAAAAKDAAPTEQPKAKPTPSANTIFTDDAAAAAIARIKSKLGRLNSVGIDPEMIYDGIIVAGNVIEKGARKFSAYASEMVGIFGDSIKPYLKSWYVAVKYDPRAAGFDGMDSAASVESAVVDSTPEPEQDSVTEDSTDAAPKPTEPSVRGGDPEGVPVAEGRRERASQPGNAPPDTGDVAPAQPGNVEATGASESDRAAGVRTSATDVGGKQESQGSGNARPGRKGAGGKKPPDAGAGDARGTDRPSVTAPESVSPANPGPGNFHIANPLEVVGGGQVARFNKNKAAIELFVALRDEGRRPTLEEQEVLAGYTGWGSFGQDLFQGSWAYPQPKQGWEQRDQWLRDHLGKSDWEGLQRSITNAHYTDPPTVMAMWEMVRRMGFKGGRVLEPGMGIGNFFGMMPLDLKERSKLAGIELDPVTGGMAQMLYPDAAIKVMGYQDSKTPDDFYDLVIGNWPFENTPVADRRYNRLNPMLHDYFFLKTLDQVRPGGIVIGITSAGSMDKKGAVVRRELAKKAELIASFRLPSGAFEDYAGTKVVTDIIVLRKRPEPASNVDGEAWVDTVEMDTPAGEKVRVNAYYQKNPQNVVGTIDYGHGTTTFRPGLIVHRPENMQAQLDRIVSMIPDGAYLAATRPDAVSYIANHTSDREGALTRTDAGLFVVRGEHLAPAHEVLKYQVKSQKDTAAREAQLNALIDMRKSYGQLIEAERGTSGAAPEPIRTQLRERYEAFVKAYGPMSESFGLGYLERIDDPFYYALAALETKDGSTYRPAAILSQSTIRSAKRITNPSIRDAFVLARNGNVNPSLDEIAKIAQKPEAMVRAELVDSGAVFETPGGDIVPSDMYLSGNVREKLRQAKVALADGNDAMQRNVAALEKVQPADIPYFNIEVQMGATWVPTRAYEQFVAHMLNRSDTDGISASYTMGRWKVTVDGDLQRSTEARTGFGTKYYRFGKLVNAAISNQTVVIKEKDSDGREFVDQTATDETNARIADMREKFGDWLWSDAERRIEIEREYNEVRNAYASPSFDGSFLNFDGMALSVGRGPFDLRQHQVNAIWRALVMRRSLNAHEVGTGKTFTMGGIAVESRRYGIAKKPVLLAHNANSKSVASEIQMMYPAAKVLYIDNLSPKAIDVRLRQIANDDWDLIVLPHSLIERLSFREETLMAMAREEIEALEAEARLAASDDGQNLTDAMLDDPDELKKLRSPTAKELVKARARIIETIKKQAQQSSREGAVPFEDLGIDMVLVDEAHEFKKPPIATRMKMKGLQTQSSLGSIQLSFLTRYVREQNNGGNVHLFTGTPITNTLTEIFHQMRYIMADEMAAVGVDQWDGWFGSFAKEVQDVELTAAGDYEAVNRLRGFINVPELRKMVGQYMDVVFSDDMPEMQPRRTASGKLLADQSLTEQERAELLNGRTEGAKDRPYKKVVNETADPTPDQMRIFEEVQSLANQWRNMGGKARRDAMSAGLPVVPIVYEQLAARASFDARMEDDEALAGKEGNVPDHPDSKVSRAIRNLLEIYRSDTRATQVVFTNTGLGTTANRALRDGAGGTIKSADGVTLRRQVKVFSPIRDMVERLVQQGVPRSEIEIVDGSTSKDRRKEIADAMNAGTVRIVIGSTQSLGVGVNMQRNLRAMHHLDAPWMPGDLEQRNGRGHRQGNQWNTVMEYRYITDRIDGRRWQVLAIKQKFITDFLKADGETRVIEGDAASDEESDIISTFAEAAGDPRVLVRQKLVAQVEQLQKRERLHTQGVADAKSTARNARDGLARQRAEIDRIEKSGAEEKAAKAVADHAGDKFRMTVDGTEFSERKAANEAIGKFISANMRTGADPMRVGSYGGLQLHVAWPPFHESPFFVAVVAGEEVTTGSASVASLESSLRAYTTTVEKLRARIQPALETIQRLDEVAGQKFQRADQLKRAEQQLLNLEKDIQLNPVPPPAWLRNGAAIDTEVRWNGTAFVVTGHRWNGAGWFVIAQDAKGGEVVIPYLEVKDAQGMPLYEAREFKAPIVHAKPGEAPKADAGPTTETVVQTNVSNAAPRSMDAEVEESRWESEGGRVRASFAKSGDPTGAERQVIAVWRKLAGTDGFFQFKRSDGKSFTEILRDVAPGIAMISDDGDSATVEVRPTKGPEYDARVLELKALRKQEAAAFEKADALLARRAPDAETAIDAANALKVEANTLYQALREYERPRAVTFTVEDGMLAMDASQLKAGVHRGSALYAVALNYAHNNGIVFVPDPAGVSDDAMIRRTEHMLSSALKFGTTRHMRPHEDQNIAWTVGDDAANLLALLQASSDNVLRNIPETATLDYDWDSLRFVDTSTAERVVEADFQRAARTDVARAARAGVSTLRRAVVHRSLARRAGTREWPRLAARLLQLSRTGLRDSDLESLAYGRDAADARPGLTKSKLESVFKAAIAGMRAIGMDVRIAENGDELAREAPGIVAQDDYDDTVQAALTGDRKTVWFVANRIKSVRQALNLFAHEMVGHYSMEQMLGPRLFRELQDRIIALKDAGKWPEIFAEVSKRYERNADGTFRALDDATFASEAIAVFAERNIRTSIVQRAMNAVRGFLRKFFPQLELSQGELRQMLWEAGQYLEGKPYRPDVAARALGERPAPRAQREAVERYAFGRSDERAPFYSALLRSIEEAKGAPKKADGAAWRQWLDGAQRRGEIKQSEREWVGVDAWLDGQQAPVTREALAEFVKGNQVQVREVVLSGDGRDSAGESAYQEFLREMVATYGPDWEFEATEDEVARREVLLSRATTPPAKFGSYQLPGGQNYLELLLTMPATEPTIDTAGWRVDRSNRDAVKVFSGSEMVQAFFRPTESDAELIRAAMPDAARIAKTRDSYTSGHWEQPNILAHVRFNERTDADGRRVLFVEEVQSDWHQAGRKKGYDRARPEPSPAAKAEKAKLIEEMQELTNDPARRRGEFNAERERRIEAIGRRFSQIDGLADENGRSLISGIPDAPLKKEWPLTAMKRMIRWAAENGFDRVAWTTGDQQAARYDLSKQVEWIKVTKEGDHYNLVADAVDGGSLKKPGLTAAQLEETIGKEIAARAVSDLKDQPAVTYEGLDLKVGGHGMRAFYDKMLPAELAKYVKRWGGNVGTTDLQMPGGYRVTSVDEEDGVMWLVTDSEGNDHSYHPRRKDAMQVAESLNAAHGSSAKQPSIDITPAMRQAAMEGQALFAKAGTIVDRLQQAISPKDTTLLQRLKDKLSDWRPAALGALQLRHLGELAERILPPVALYSGVVQRMATMRNELQELGHKVVEAGMKYQGANPEESKRLFRMLHDATLAGVDPSGAHKPLRMMAADYKTNVDVTDESVRAFVKLMKEQAELNPGSAVSYVNRAKEARKLLSQERKRRVSHKELAPKFAQLSDDGKALWAQMRDAYAAQSDEYQAALISRIESLSFDKSKKAGQIARMRLQFESARVPFYVPLARWGEYWVSGTNSEGQREFFMQESQADQARVRKELANAGYLDIGHGVKLDTVKAQDGASASFMADMDEMLAESGAPEKIRDEAFQLYLRSLPDLSMRKNFIHRQGTPGFSQDAVRALAGHIFHGSFQIARLRYSHELEALRTEAEDMAKDMGKNGDEDANAAGNIVNELKKRHEWVMNPQDNALVNKISSIGFIYYLGLTPAAALVNLLQTPMVALPILAGKHKLGAATRELTRALKESLGTYGHMQTKLTGEELEAHKEFARRGVFDKTQAHNMAGISESDTHAYSPTWHKAMTVISHVFHKAEVVNREATAMAAYRLERAAGAGHVEAVEAADRAVHESQFDYSNANRARFMQSGTAKVLLMFRQYSLAVTWLLGRNMYQAFKGEDAATKKEAQRKLAGILGMTAIFSGTLGLPIIGTVGAVLNAVAAAFGDDDEPWDWETEFRAFLREMLGETGAEAVLRGPVQAATGVGIASRVSMGDLWFREPDRELEGRAWSNYLFEQAAGPMGGLITNFFRAQQLMGEGHVWRGVETAMPKAIKDGLKSIRYLDEGVNNLRGDAIVEDLNVFESLAQIAGFAPASVANAYDVARDIKNYEQAILNRRSRLMDAFALAWRLGDVEAREAVLGKMRAFSATYPELAITGDSIRRSLMQRAKASTQADNGVIIDRRIRARLEGQLGM